MPSKATYSIKVTWVPGSDRKQQGTRPRAAAGPAYAGAARQRVTSRLPPRRARHLPALPGRFRHLLRTALRAPERRWRWLAAPPGGERRAAARRAAALSPASAAALRAPPRRRRPGPALDGAGTRDGAAAAPPRQKGRPGWLRGSRQAARRGPPERPAAQAADQAPGPGCLT